MSSALKRRWSRPLVALAILSATIVLLAFTAKPLLELAGTFLDVGQPPQKADAALVLAGGGSGDRILKAAELQRAGFVPLVYVSGPKIEFESPECALSIPFATRRGYDAASFRCIESWAYSTREELFKCCLSLRESGVRKVLLVTTAYHTRRAMYLARQICPDIEVIPVSSESRNFTNRRWFAAREGRKAIFLEYLKLASAPFGI